MKCATVHLRKRIYYIASDSELKDGGWISTPPVYAVALGDLSTLGARVIDALSASGSGVPTPTDWSTITAPFYAAAGVKSEAQFVTGCLLLTVELTDDALRIIPMVNLGAREGFERISSSAREFGSILNARDLGSAIQEVFALCR